MSRKFIVKESTRKRCKIIPATPEALQNFRPISLELFSYLWEVSTIDFCIYLKVEDEIIQYIRPSELSIELLQHVWLASLKDDAGVDVFVARKDFPRLEHTLSYVRQKKINALLEKDPSLDRKTLEIFSDLSGASQMVLRGGVDRQVAERIKTVAAMMVHQLMDNDSAMGTLSRMISIDPSLYDHSASVAMFATVMSKQVLKGPISQKEAELIAQAGLYHDAGKSCIPNAVLNKPGAFTPEEFEIMKTHVQFGFKELTAAIAAGAPIDEKVAQVALEHHERFTGKGYPFGKKGRFEDDPVNGIHVYARIVSIADAYSALLMKRVYKPALPAEKALELMQKSAPEDFDPLIFEPFVTGVSASLKKVKERADQMTGNGQIFHIDKEKGDSLVEKIKDAQSLKKAQ